MSTLQMDTHWRRFHPAPSKPTFTLPRGAVDTHCHVFGPGKIFPYAPERRYTPCDASKQQLWALRDFLGIERNVIVQASCHGNDNRAVMDALQDAGQRARGVAVITENLSDAELQRMDAAGMRGVRFNFLKRLGDTPSHATLLRIAQRIRPLGWHLVIYFEADELPRLYDFLASLSTIVVLDHMGCPDVSRPVDGPEFALLLKLLREHSNFWCKVSCPERLSQLGPPFYDDVVPYARHIVESFPERVLWGTDWPHPNMKTHTPDDGHLVDFVPKIARTAQLQQRLLVDNPHALYWDR